MKTEISQAINSNTEDWTAYYDLEKQGWLGSFSTFNFKEIEG